MMDLMKDFVFEYVTADQIIEDVDNNTGGFDHPYIYGNQESFDKLKAVYYAKPGDEDYDMQLQNWLKNDIVSDGVLAYENYAKWSHTYVNIEKNYVVDENGEPVYDEVTGEPIYVKGEPDEKYFELKVYYGNSSEFAETGELTKLADNMIIPAF